MSFRSSASFGKRQEYIAVAELLRRGHDVYMTLVDDQQIDCVIRQEKEEQLRYLDIQIKARSKDCKNSGMFAAMEIRKPRKDFYFIFYSEKVNTYWVIPSLELVEQARRNKSGQNKGKYTINFCNATQKGASPRPRFKNYENAFNLLEWSSQAIAEVEQTQVNIPNEIAEETKPVEKKKDGLPLKDCWREVEMLQGQTLKTLDQRKPFDIVEVTESKVEIFIQSTGNPRTIWRKEIEGACRELRTRGEITRAEIEERYSPRNPAFVAAILAAFPGIRYTLKPIWLRF